MIPIRLTRDQMKFLMMLEPNAEAIRKFTGPLPDGSPLSDEGALGAVHKARYLEFKQMVEESEAWLNEHGMDIPLSFEDAIERARLASTEFKGDN